MSLNLTSKQLLDEAHKIDDRADSLPWWRFFRRSQLATEADYLRGLARMRA